MCFRLIPINRGYVEPVYYEPPLVFQPHALYSDYDMPVGLRHRNRVLGNLYAKTPGLFRGPVLPSSRRFSASRGWQGSQLGIRPSGMPAYRGGGLRGVTVRHP